MIQLEIRSRTKTATPVLLGIRLHPKSPIAYDSDSATLANKTTKKQRGKTCVCTWGWGERLER